MDFITFCTMHPNEAGYVFRRILSFDHEATVRQMVAEQTDMKIPNVILHLVNINPLFFTPLPTPAEGLFAFQSEVHRYVESPVLCSHISCAFYIPV